LGLSRNTIVNALDQLLAEGYLEVVRGVGTFVAQTLHARPREMNLRGRAERDVIPSKLAEAFLAQRDGAANLPGAVPFRPGIPALDLFPSAQFRRAFGANTWTVETLDYPEPFGDSALREAIAQRLSQTRGVACTRDQVIVTCGTQAAFALICHVLLQRGDVAIIEEPGYVSVRAILASFGARLLPIQVDDAGIDVARFARRRAKLVHTTPSHQYPTGGVLSLERRFALLDWAAAHNAWIVEDDYDSEFNYSGRAQPALFGLGEGRNVVYVGTFSKVLAPALRVAFVVVPRALRASFEAAKVVLGGQPSGVLQSALATFMVRGHFARHVTKMRKVYDERRVYTSVEFQRAFASVAQLRDTRAGLHFIALLPKDVHDAQFSSRAKAAGFIVPPLSSYFVGQPRLNGIVLGFAASAPPASKEAIRVLAELI
jgi:GntR family transcriptional regulator / MocR family aminotransferase